MSDTDNSKKRVSEASDEFPNQKKPRVFCNDGPPVNSDPVMILVGKVEEKFFVHAHLLESSSEFFKKALKKEWKEGQERMVKLPDADVPAFKIYAKWLYTGRFYSFTEAGSPTTSSQDFTPGLLFNCYELGDFICALDFLDALADVILERTVQKGQSPVHLSTTIYPRSGKDSPHRKLCRDLVVHSWSHDSFNKLRDEAIPREFLEDVMLDMGTLLHQGVKRQTFPAFSKDKDACYYHEHTRYNTPCYKTKYGV